MVINQEDVILFFKLSKPSLKILIDKRLDENCTLNYYGCHISIFSSDVVIQFSVSYIPLYSDIGEITFRHYKYSESDIIKKIREAKILSLI